MKPKLLRGVLLGIIIGGLAPPSVGLALNYKPKPGESLSYLALIHYGSSAKYVYLAAANSIPDPDKIPENITLWVPTVWKYRIKKGDYLAKLSTQYLRDPKRSSFLIWLNQIRNPLDLGPGTIITMPFVLPYRVQRGDTLLGIAEKYYPHPRKILGMLKSFNQKKSSDLEAGEILDIPIFDEEASYTKVKERLRHHEQQQAGGRKTSSQKNGSASASFDDNAKQSASGLIDSTSSSFWNFDLFALLGVRENKNDQPLSERALIRLAFDLYWSGEYEEAQEMIEATLERRQLPPTSEAKLRELLASCLIAMDRVDEAEKQFHRLLELNPQRNLDPVNTSPKILVVFERVKSKHDKK